MPRPPQELLELKRLQIRAPKANEAVIVKQLTERFNATMKSLASQGEKEPHEDPLCAGDQYKGPDSFKDFESFLYATLQGVQEQEPARKPSPSLR